MSINLHGAASRYEPRIDSLKLDSGLRFSVIRFGVEADVIVPGYDLASVAYLRSVAAACTDAADALAGEIANELSQLEGAVA